MIKDIVYLNGEFIPLESALISPLDRGFLFGDSVYEFIPVHDGRAIGCKQHIKRLMNSLVSISINLSFDMSAWLVLVNELIGLNGASDLGVYIQVSRGTDTKRHHAFPKNISPTVFMMCSEIQKPLSNSSLDELGCNAATQLDQRWRNCHIKTTSLLGNILHFQHGQNKQMDETLLYNDQGMLTEATSCNVFIVSNKSIVTPRLDHQILPGITRALLIEILNGHSNFTVVERDVSMDEVYLAQEIWLTSSSKEVMPVLQLDDHVVGKGEIGEVCKQAITLFNHYKFDY